MEPEKPWKGSRKNLLWGLPIAILILGFLIFAFFFHLDPVTEDLTVPRVLVVILTLFFAFGSVYALFRDSWWIYLPFNQELFKVVSENLESALTGNGISSYPTESSLLTMVSGRQAKQLRVPANGCELFVVAEMVTRERGEKGVSTFKIHIQGISKQNIQHAIELRKAITKMLLSIGYMDFPSHRVRRR